ncbi:MAG: hypothetical protein AAFU61_15260, partial [Pseudomonadota bacterium]
MTRLFLEDGRETQVLGGAAGTDVLLARGRGTEGELAVTLAPPDPDAAATREHVLLARQVGVLDLDFDGEGAIALAPLRLTGTRGDDDAAISLDGLAAFRGQGTKVSLWTGAGDDAVRFVAVAGEADGAAGLSRGFIGAGRGADDVAFYISNVGTDRGFALTVSTGAGADTVSGKSFVARDASDDAGAQAPSAPAPSVLRMNLGGGDDLAGTYFCDETRDAADAAAAGDGPTSWLRLGGGDDMALVSQFSAGFGGVLKVRGGRGDDVMQVTVTDWDFLQEPAQRLPSVAGGRGADVFVLERGETSARIVDLTLGEDAIALAGGIAFGDLVFGQRGEDVAIFDAD